MEGIVQAQEMRLKNISGNFQLKMHEVRILLAYFKGDFGTFSMKFR
jgi:hypothetical protein